MSISFSLLLQFVPARVHISSRVKLVGLAMGKENSAAHVTTTQNEHSTSDLGNFGQYFTKGKALAKPTSKENCLYFWCAVHIVPPGIATQLSAARYSRATKLRQSLQNY